MLAGVALAVWWHATTVEADPMHASTQILEGTGGESEKAHTTCGASAPQVES